MGIRGNQAPPAGALALSEHRLRTPLFSLPGKLKTLLKKNALLCHAVRKFRCAFPGKNRLKVFPSEVSGNRVVYRWKVSGEWRACFTGNSVFEITYPFSLENIPEGVRMIPFLAQVLPAAWICNAEIFVPECDADFFHCLDSVKAGYCSMYPMIPFGGKLTAGRLTSDASTEQKDHSLVCYSGGVDAACTVLSHLQEAPSLVSLWGADVPWTDTENWKVLESLLRSNADQLGLELLTVRSSFRGLLSVKNLGFRIKASGDGWWHGFQHGLGILGHLAPVAWKTGASTVYIASSNVARDKCTCASDPTIDNFVRFCGARVIHDGYDLNRQQKIRKIVSWTAEKGIALPLHVCWEKHSGDNCCHCEKCWRTILGLCAEGADPRDFGFPLFDGFRHLSEDLEADYHRMMPRFTANYRPLQDALREKMKREYTPPELTWLSRVDLPDLENGITKLHDGRLVTPCPLLLTPDYANMGDHFIAEAEKDFIRSLLPDRDALEFTGKQLSGKNYAQLEKIPPSRTVYITGGGSIGSIWKNAERQKEEIISRLKNHRIVIFPQSIWFSRDAAGRKALARAKEIYRGDRILLFCRDKVSLALARKHFDCPSLLVPDIVLWKSIKPKQPAERSGALALLRDDKERVLSVRQKQAVLSVLSSRFRSVAVSDTRLSPTKIVSRTERPEQMEALITRIASAECVVTDRLHGMVLSAVTGTPCVAFRNSYHKVEACYEWLKDLGWIRFIRETRELEEAVRAVCSCTDRIYPEAEMQRLFEPLARCIRSLELPS